MKALRSAVVLCLALVVYWTSSLAHADYRFSVPRMQMTVDIQPNASAVIFYEIEFENHGDTIDVVDVGMPHEDYDTANMRAWMDGEKLNTRIVDSTYVDGSVEVPLSGHTISRGSRGLFRFEATVPDMVFSDTTNDALASFRITPTWFDPNLVQGTTDLTITVRLPQGAANDDKVVYHKGQAFTDRRVEGGRTVVEWSGAHPPSGPRMVGVSFPRKVMTRVVEITWWDLFWAWWKRSTAVRCWIYFIHLIVIGFSFFRMSRGTGWTMFAMLAIIGGFVVVYLPAGHLVIVVALLAAQIWIEVHMFRGRKGYLPPVISVEGGGIKRGLTAPEAAVLLERPLPQVVTLVAFGLLKKGLLAQEGEPGVTVLRTVTRMRNATKEAVLAHAGRIGVVVHEYEHEFISAFSGIAVDGPELHLAIKGLLDHTVSRVAGHDVDQTRDYYRKVVERAWTEAGSSAAASAADREALFDNRLEWLWLDSDAATRFDSILPSGVHYSPPWTRLSVPIGGSSSSGGGGGSSGGVSAAVSRITPSFSDVSASVVGWAEASAESVVSTLMPGSSVDLGHVDQGFADAIKALGESSGSGRGGGGRSGGGCACACAGCACACACAGGGR